MLLDNRLFDIAGLHDKQIALHGFSASLIVDQYKPDILFAPHLDYLEWGVELSNDPHLKRDYEIFPLSAEPRHFVAVRRDSPCAAAVRPIFQAVADELNSHIQTPLHNTGKPPGQF